MHLTPSRDLEDPTWDEVFSEPIPAQEGAVNDAAWRIPPLVDVFFEKTAYVWMRLLPTGIDGDLEADRFDLDSIGDEPAWMDEYDDNLAYMLIPGIGDMRGVTFALENGIAPGQPFLLELDEPVYSVDYWGEADSTCDFAIVRTLPAPNPAARFERCLHNIRRWRAEREGRHDRLRAAQRVSRAHMQIRCVHVVDFGLYGEEYRLRLESKLQWKTAHNPNSLIYTEGATLREAMDLLVEKAYDELGLEASFIRTLQVRW